MPKLNLQPNRLREGRKVKYIKNKKQYINCINTFVIICPAQILIAVAFLLTIHILSATGVNTVNIINTNCLTINCIFNFINKYINIAITIAVVIAFPVFIDDIIPSPSNPSSEEFAFTTNKVTNELFTNNKNFINNGASAIASPPQK
mgnify:CR=1 FL=1